ncbi:MAG TPA: ACT domain-containing protein [Opitutaceae bacterium]|nr:ACT domain-containing protein [Opitutaceae bacterium]
METSSSRTAGRRVLWLDGEFAICRLAASAVDPEWARADGSFCSITRTADELSIICKARRVPAGVRCTRGWRLARIAGALPPDAVGVLASLLTPLAAAGVSVFACATFDTDYLLVQENRTGDATRALEGAGHSVLGA